MTETLTEDVLVDDDVAEEEIVEDEVVESEEDNTLQILKALAIRSSLGHTGKLKLRVPGMGTLNDERFYIVFNDASSDAIDAYTDALNQTKATESMQVDEETGLVVGEQKTEQHRRYWPLLDVVIDFGLIREAVLPAYDDKGAFTTFVWGKNGATNRRALRKGKLLTVTTILHMASDHILGSETGDVVSQLGE